MRGKKAKLIRKLAKQFAKERDTDFKRVYRFMKKEYKSLPRNERGE